MNKKLVRIVACVAVSILGAAGSASARVIDKNRFKGNTAFAVCSQTEEIVCDFGVPGTIQTDIFVSGEEFVTRSDEFPADAQNHVFVTARKFNSCTQELSASFGNVENGVSFQGTLQSATLLGVVPLKDFDTEQPAGSMSVNLNFQGFGAVGKDKSRIRFDFENPEGTITVISINLRGKTRSATVSGSLSFNGTPVTCAFTDVTLTDTNNGDKTLEHP
jgi:hypothetical protein